MRSEVVGCDLVGMATGETLEVAALSLHGVQEDPSFTFSEQASSLIVTREL
jgi:hypothetical protein